MLSASISRAMSAIRGISTSGLRSGFVGGLDHDLGVAGGVVGHPLEFGGDVDHRRDRPQVAGHRRLGGDQEERALFGLPAVVVDVPIGGHDLAGERDILARSASIERAIALSTMLAIATTSSRSSCNLVE